MTFMLWDVPQQVQRVGRICLLRLRLTCNRPCAGKPGLVTNPDTLFGAVRQRRNRSSLGTRCRRQHPLLQCMPGELSCYSPHHPKRDCVGNICCLANKYCSAKSILMLLCILALQASAQAGARATAQVSVGRSGRYCTSPPRPCPQGGASSRAAARPPERRTGSGRGSRGAGPALRTCRQHLCCGSRSGQGCSCRQCSSGRCQCAAATPSVDGVGAQGFCCRHRSRHHSHHMRSGATSILRRS
jgi:hypothetical protein